MEPQRTLASRYQLVAHLARGGMADVFEAEDRLLNRRVAVKVLHAQFAGDQSFVQRFRREAQAAANLSHPNIVSIYDWGYDAGTYFMVMELIKGRTLRDIIRQEGALLPRRAAEIGAEVAAALAVSHRSSLSHRDVKPGNIMLTGDGTVKVTDFGIARALDDSEELTRTGAVIGTATYFSPEQAQGIPADGRSDIYSLGVVLFELLAGQPPFSGESPVSVAYQHVSELPPAPSAINPEIPTPLENIVLRALEKDPKDRYQSADDMRADLLAYLSGGPPAAAMPVQQSAAAGPPDATEMMQAPPPATVPPDETARHVAYVEEERPPLQYGFVLGVIALVVVLVVAAFVLSRLLSGSDPSTDVVAVPTVAGQQFDDAVAVLQEAELKVQASRISDPVVAADIVIGTEPPAGTEVERGSFVTVIISTGPSAFPVPLVVGEELAAARSALESNGFVVVVTTEFSADIAEGIVISQDPAGGSDAAPGATVTIVVSTGPEAVEVPDLEGLAERTAVFELLQSGFVANEDQIVVVEEFSSEIESGFVIRTEPAAGELVGPNTPITLFVSKGLPVVPDLTGLTVVEARQALRDLELTLELDSNTVLVDAESGLVGLIAEQDPVDGSLVEPGSTVVVRLGAVLRVVVADVVGDTEETARTTLEAQFLVVSVTEVPVDPDQVGLVITQTPEAGTEVNEGTVVEIEVGVARMVVVPNLVGLNEAAARAALQDVGLLLEITFVVDDNNVDLVISQDPAADEEIAEGSTVQVTIGEASPEEDSTTTTTEG